MSEWLKCDYCPEGDNEWTEDAFTLCGNAYGVHKRMCNACFAERFRKRWTRCVRCERKLDARARNTPPTCRKCRDEMLGRAELREGVAHRCERCGTGLKRHLARRFCKPCAYASAGIVLV